MDNSKQETVTCRYCDKQIKISLGDITKSVNDLLVRCPYCGINTPVSWMIFSSLGGDCSLF